MALLVEVTGEAKCVAAEAKQAAAEKKAEATYKQAEAEKQAEGDAGHTKSRANM